MKTIEFDSGWAAGTVTFDDSRETRDRVFDMLIENYYARLCSFSGESIMQDDESISDAPDILADIADDILKFDVRYDKLDEKYDDEN